MVVQYGFTRQSAPCGGAQTHAEAQLMLMSPVQVAARSYPANAPSGIARGFWQR
jgi:hypothetical protein